MPKSLEGAAREAGKASGIDWDLLGRVLPRWMFERLNEDVARRSTVLVRRALEGAWSESDLREVLAADRMPESMRSPAGLVLSRVKSAVSRPAPSLLRPSEESGGAGLRDVDEELRRLRSWMLSFGWSLSNPGFPFEIYF